MDQIASIIERFGFPIFCAISVGYVYWKSTNARISALEGALKEARTFERDTLTGLVRESHTREREFLHMVRDERKSCPLINQETATPEPHNYDPNDTQAVMEAVRERHSPRGNTGRRSGEYRP